MSNASVPKAAKSCTWTYCDIDDYFNTSCKRAYCLVEGTLKETEHRFCPYCGGTIIEEA